MNIRSLIRFVAEFELTVFALAFAVGTCAISIKAALFMVSVVLTYAFPPWRTYLEMISQYISRLV